MKRINPDDMAEHWIATCQTQSGIIAFVKKAAEVLSAAGKASSQATGDSPEYAIRKWGDVMIQEAIRLHREPPPATDRKRLQ